jgi:hypothetical protein
MVEPYKRVIYEQQHREQRSLQVKLRDLKAASGDAWSDLREGLERSWDELSHAFNLAVKRFQ